jgi:2-phosphoglycerate kinase
LAGHSRVARRAYTPGVPPHGVPPASAAPPWSVLLLGGSSGVGKSTVAPEVARRTGAALTQVDDIRLALQAATTPATHPDLHFFLRAPGEAKEGVWARPPEELCRGLIRVAGVVSRALEDVVAHHVATRRPLLLEGDGLLPALATQQERWGLPLAGHVRAVFIYEEDEAALLETIAGRGRGYDDKARDEQRAQAHTNWLYGRWLAREAARAGLPAVPARP